MKKSFMIGLLLLVIGIAGVLFTFGGSGGSFSFKLTPIDQSERFPAAGITSLKADIASADIRFEAASGDEIEVHLEGRNSKRYADQIKLIAEADGDTLVVRTEAPRFQIGIIISELNLRIAVPEKLWASVDVRAGSGNITAQELRAAQIELQAGSGNMRLTSLESDRLIVRTGSGNVNITGYIGDTAEVDVSSGEVKLVDVEAALNVRTGSGDVEYEAASIMRDTAIRTGSGDVDMAIDEAPQSLAVDFHTNSGNAKVRFDEFNRLDGSGRDGRVNGSFGDGSAKLTVRTGSGDIELERR